VTSKTTKRFWKLLEELTTETQLQARVAYQLFAQNPYHPSLQFKALTDFAEPLYSVRIGAHYRALGLLEHDEITWIWIGTHSQYNKVLAMR
jgi:hypothetical protein